MSHITNIEIKLLNSSFSNWRRAVKGAIIRSFSALIVAAAVLLGLLTIPAMAATTLSTGDIAFIGINTDGNDDFAFVLLKDISAGTSIKITDKGWNDGVGFYDTDGGGDGIWEWSTSSALTAGTIVNIKTTNNGIIEAGSLAASPGSVILYEDNGNTISYSGDQLFLYQGTEATPTIIAGIHWNVEPNLTTYVSNNENWDGSATSTQTSALPDQLTNGVNAIWVYQAGPTEQDNFRYKYSTSPTSGTPSELRAAIYNLNNWDVDTTGTTAYTLNPFPCSFSVTVPPAISSASYSANTGTLIVSGTNFEGKIGAANDITVSKLTLRGEGGTTYPLTSSDVEIDSVAQFTVSLNATDLAAVNQIINKNGTSSTGGTTYNLAVSDDWCANVTDGDISDATIALTVSNVAVPAIASATYDADTGVLAVTGTGFFVLSGAANDIVTNKLTITGEGGANYTLTSASVEITSGTSFTVTLNATDKAEVNLIVNKNGTSSIDATTYNLAAAEDWAAGADAAVNVADLTGNGITASNVSAAPEVSGLPTDITVTEDLLSNVDLSAATFSDADSVALTVTLSSSAGTFTAASGGSVTIGGSGTGTLTLSGTVANINTYLDTPANIRYTGAADQNGDNAATFTVHASDGTVNPLLGTVNIDIGAVNDDPLISGLPTDITVIEDAASNADLSAASLTDVDAASGAINLTLTAGAGTLSATSGGGVTVSGSGTSTLTLSGTVANIDTYLNTASNIQYTGLANANGDNATTLALTVNDGGNTGTGGGGNVSLGSVNIDITAVNDEPSFTIGANQTVDQGTGPQTVNSFITNINDGDPEVTQTVSFTVSNNNTALFTTQPSINSSGTLTYTPDATKHGNAIVTVSISDNGGTANGGDDQSPDQTFTISITPDAAPPTATVTINDTALKVGDTATVTITFSEAVSGFANDDLTIPNGTLTPVGSSDGNITFMATYTPTVDVEDVTNVIVLAMTGVTDIAGNAGTGTASTANFTIDTRVPTVSNVTSTKDNGTYGIGETIVITVSFSETVTVTGTPQLLLETGTDDRTVNYSSGSGSSNLNFSYTTQAGDESDDLDYASTSALTGTIKDAADNDATLTLPSPGAANSLGANKAIVVKAFPSVSLSASSSSIAEDGGSSTITAALSQAYTQDVIVSLSYTGSATNITDYTRSADSITINAGASSGSITITGIDDAVDDDNETIIVDMTGGSNCIENGIQQITVTINEAPDIPAAPALQSAAAGDGHVNVSWSSVSGAAGYKVFASTTSGAYTTPVATVADSVYSCDVAGLTNGTTYYFVVKATNAGGDSTNSNELSATPQAAALGAPIIQSAVAGDRHVNLSWSTVFGVTGYKVFSSTISGNYTTPATTVAASVYSCDVTELTNGTTYYFVVKASNAGGDSANSNEVSATPKNVPGAPSNVTATAGNRYAAVSFTAPADDGGSPVTGYLVTSNPGNITATGTGTSITITGLTNGTAYTFTVKAVNAVGNGPDSTASNAVTPHRPSDGDSAPSTPTIPPASNPGIEILVNGEAGNAGTVTTTTEGETTTTIITIDSQKIEQKLKAQGNHATVTIPVNTQADVVISEINGQTVKNMESKEAILEIKTEGVTYTLPAAQINIDDVLRQIGQEVELKDIKVSVKIAEPSAETVKIVEDTANKNNYQIVVRPIEFEITCTSGDKIVDVSRFNAYIERTIAIPEGIDPDKITTGVVLNADGTFSPVSTTIVNLNGKYFVKIKSLSNSTYAVIYNHQEFKDVEKHWAKEAINDMGSRLIISGVGNDMFEPDRDISRAEFAAIMVRALGLKTGLGKNPFSDVPDDAWYCSSIMTAVEYKIVNGYGKCQFGPLDKITREQAMTMIANAMNTTRLQTEVSESEFKTLFSSLEIEGEPVDWAKNSVAVCIKTGVVEKNDGDIKIIKGNISRGEVAVTVRRLLQKSKLI